MSLQVWLPLNGNLNNQGLLSTTVTSSTAAYNTSGKIGKCYNNTTSGIKVQYSHFNTGQLSIAVWVKPNSPASWADIFSIGQYCNRLEKNTGTGYYWYTSDVSKALIANGTSLGISLTNGVWYHIAVTIDGATTKIYVNGSLSFTATQPNRLVDVVGSDSSIYCGARQLNGGGYASYLNDFRIYDHCLSPMEVKEISKGLVCHYKLSSQFETGQVNKYSGNSAGGLLSGFTATKLTDEPGYNYKVSYTGTGSNNWLWLSLGSFTFTSGKTYYYSCKVRCHSANFVWSFRAARLNNDYFGTESVNVLVADGEWHEYVVKATITTTFTYNGTTYTSAPRVEFCTANLVTSGTVYSADFDVKDIQVIESDCYVPFIDNSMTSSTIIDCSGYGNTATKTGTINWSSDSRRYSGSYIPANTSSYLSTTLTTSGYANSYTIAYWAKISDMNKKMAFGFSDGNRLNLYPTGSVICWNTGDGSDNPFKNNGTSISYTSYNGGWHHYAITGNGTTTTLYIDGVRVGDATTYKGITGTKLFISGWDTSTSYKWAGGNISDFRIYATPLSAQDIKSLYQTAASVSKSGIMAAYEFIEE